MIKKLKTLEQVKKEYRNRGFGISQHDESCQIDFNGSDMGNYIIAVTMFKYFGKEINVIVAGRRSDKYEWYIGEKNNNWWFKDDWFELDVDLLLEDDLFDI